MHRHKLVCCQDSHRRYLEFQSYTESILPMAKNHQKWLEFLLYKKLIVMSEKLHRFLILNFYHKKNNPSIFNAINLRVCNFHTIIFLQ